MNIKHFTPKNIIKYVTAIYRISRFKKVPIIIGGCGRTGTTLMSAILDAHVEIVSLSHETGIFSSRRSLEYVRCNYYKNIYRLYLRLINQGVPSNSLRWCEKTPKNVNRLDSVFEEFGENIKVILMIRDAKDVLTSSHPEAKGYYVSLERWVSDTKDTLVFENHSQVMIVPYEALVNEFDISIKKITRFLGLSNSTEMREFSKFTNIQAHDAFHGGKIMPIYSKSVMRWKDSQHAERMVQINNSEDVTLLNNRVQLITNEFLNH